MKKIIPIIATALLLTACGSTQQEARQPTQTAEPTEVSTSESVDDILNEASQAGDQAGTAASDTIAAKLTTEFIKSYCPSAKDLTGCTEADPAFKHSEGFWPTPDNDVRASFTGSLDKGQRDSIATLIAGVALHHSLEFTKLSVTDDGGDHVYKMDELVAQLQG